MPFQVPPSKADEPQNRYTFTIDGVDYDVPKLGYVPVERVEEMADAAFSSDVVFRAACLNLFGAADSDAGKAVRALSTDQFDALREDYFKASRIDAGESSASTDS